MRGGERVRRRPRPARGRRQRLRRRQGRRPADRPRATAVDDRAGRGRWSRRCARATTPRSSSSRPTDVADYSRITQGVDVERTPALVVVQPQAADRGPAARGDRQLRLPRPESVDQAVDDALYDGPREHPVLPGVARARDTPGYAATARRHGRRGLRALPERRAPRAARRLPAASTGAAGGAPCGDLIRISLALARRARSSASASTPRAAPRRAPPPRRSPSSPRARPCSTRRSHRPRRRSPPSSAGSGPQGRHAAELAADALHRALAAAAGSRRAARARPPAGGERVLVALSGGVDTAVAALLERERGAEVVAVTLKLWSDQRTDGERSCCSPHAVLGARGARALARDPAPDARPRGRASAPASSSGFLAGYAAGRTPNPCVSATASCGSTR